jgi:hypothetical protein
VVRQGRVEAIAVLAAIVVAPQDGVRSPALAVKVGVVGRQTTAFGLRLLRLQELVSLPEGRVQLAFGVPKVLVRGSLPIGLTQL